MDQHIAVSQGNYTFTHMMDAMEHHAGKIIFWESCDDKNGETKVIQSFRFKTLDDFSKFQQGLNRFENALSS